MKNNNIIKIIGLTFTVIVSSFIFCNNVDAFMAGTVSINKDTYFHPSFLDNYQQVYISQCYNNVGGYYNSGGYVSGGSSTVNTSAGCYKFEDVCKDVDSLGWHVTYVDKLKTICEGLDKEGEYNQNADSSNKTFDGKYFDDINNGLFCTGYDGGNIITSSVVDSVDNYSYSSGVSVSYGPLERVITYPGGPYVTRFSYAAAISYTYLAGYKCAYIRYTTGAKLRATCSEALKANANGNDVYAGTSSFGGGAPNIGNWEQHPSVVSLTENILGASSATMTFNECKGSGCPQVKNAPTSTYGYSQPSGSGTISNRNLANSEMTPALAGAGDIVIGTESDSGYAEGTTYSKTDSNGDGVIDDNDNWVKLKSKSHSESGIEYVPNAASGRYCPGDTFTSSAKVQTKVLGENFWAYRSSYKDITGVNCTINENSTSTCCGWEDYTDPITGKTKRRCDNYYVDYTYNCDISWVRSYIEYYRPEYVTVNESISGWYELDGEYSPDPDRFDAIKAKYIPVDTLTGDYSYIISSDQASFGTRQCNLYVRTPDGGPDPDIHWSDMLYFRNVEVNDLFPGRLPGRNWQGYDYSIVPTKQTKSMYSIDLSSAAMRKIARNTDTEDYVKLNLGSNYKPIDSDGKYNYTYDHGYVDFNALRNLGAVIVENKDVIISRNKELLENGYNKYIYNIND